MANTLTFAAIAYGLALAAAITGILILGVTYDFESPRARLLFVAKTALVAAVAIIPAVLFPVAIAFVFWGVALIFS